MDMIDQYNYLKQLIPCKKYPQISIIVEQKTKTIGENILPEKFQPLVFLKETTSKSK